MIARQSLIGRVLATVQDKSNWGSKLFYTILVAMLIFFWWLLIYSGGAIIVHG